MYNLHSNVCSVALRRTSSKTRSRAELCLLVVALCGFGVLCISHLSFIQRSNNVGGWTSKSIPLHCLSSIPGFDASANVTHVIVSDGELEESFAYTVTASDDERQVGRRLNESSTCINDESASRRLSFCSSQPLPQDVTLSYSRVKGFLYLPLETSVLHNISTQYVFVVKSDVHCFGEPFLQALVERILGVETVALNWLIGMTTSGNDNGSDNDDEMAGYVYNPRTQQVIALSTQLQKSSGIRADSNGASSNTSTIFFWKSQFLSSLPHSHVRQTILFKVGVLLTSVFLFFITTTLVSFTLHETQERMLHFTFVLQEYVRQERPLASLIVKHVVENLVFVPIMVGVFFFLIEFYGGDKLLAFGVLTIVWVCQVFGIIA